MFVSGAIGMELVSGWWVSRHGDSNVTFLLLTTVEENLEMLGALLAIVVLTGHIRREGLRLQVVRGS